MKHLNILGQVIKSWGNNDIFANFIKYVGGLWVLFTGVHHLFYAVTTLIIFDVVTGVFSALKSGIKFSSRKLRKGLIERFLVYNAVLIVIWIVERMIKQSIDYDAFYGVTLAAVMIGSYEVSSILENLVKMYPEYKVLNKIGNILNIFETSVERKLKKKLEMEEEIIDFENGVAVTSNTVIKEEELTENEVNQPH